MNIFIVSTFCLFMFIIIRSFIKKEFTIKNISEDKLIDHINALLFRGFDGAYCIITKSKKIPFLQIKKKVMRKGCIDIEMMFPIVEWSRRYVEDITQILESDNYEYSFYTYNGKNFINFIKINFGDNSENVAQFFQTVFKDVFEYDETIPYRFRYSRISPYDVKIGF